MNAEDSKTVDRWIEREADRFFDSPELSETPDVETQEAMARLLITEFLDRFDTAFAESVAELSKNYAVVGGLVDEKVAEGILIRDDNGRLRKAFKH